MEKIKVIKQKEKGYNGGSRYSVTVGDRELADMVTGIKTSFNTSTGLTTVTLEFVTNDFEWKNEE